MLSLSARCGHRFKSRSHLSFCRPITSQSTYQLLSWFSDLPSTTTLQSGLLQLHDACGNWSLEIFATTTAARILLSVPVMTYSRNLFTTYAITTHPIRIQERKFRQEMDDRLRAGSMPPQMAKDMRLKGIRLMRSAQQETIEKYNVHPGKGLVVIAVESVFWISFAAAVRNMVAGYPPEWTASGHTDLSVQGLLWFKDMTIPDPYCILPSVSSLVLLTSVQLMAAWRRQNGIPELRLHSIIKWGSYPMAAWLFYCTSGWPAIIPYYMSISMIYGAIQAYAFTHPAIQRALGIADVSGRNPVPVSFKRWLQDEGFTRRERN